MIKNPLRESISMPSLNMFDTYPPSIYLFKVSDRNTWKRCEICLKLTIKTSERSLC